MTGVGIVIQQSEQQNHIGIHSIQPCNTARTDHGNAVEFETETSVQLDTGK